jgi:hypothetical protein
MAIEHARLCGACEQNFPGWADRCPACGSTSLVQRIVIIPTPEVAPSARVIPAPKNRRSAHTTNDRPRRVARKQVSQSGV